MSDYIYISIALLFPIINGKGYYGAIILIIFSLFNLFNNDLTKSSLYLLILSLIEIVLYNVSALNSISLYNNKMIFNDHVSIMIPFFMYNLTNSSKTAKINKDGMTNILIYIILVESITGIAQLAFPAARDIIIKLYASQEKYAQRYKGEIVSITGTVGNPNSYAAIIAVVANVLLYIIITQSLEERKRTLIIGIIIISIIDIVISRSRTGIIIFFSMFIYILIVNKRYKGLFLLIISEVGLLIIFWNTIETLLIFQRFADRENMRSLGGRIYIWDSILDLLINQPICKLVIGNGKNFYKSILTAIDNGYLEALVSYGIAGIFLMILKYGFLWNYTRNRNRKNLKRIILIGILLFLITSELDFISTIVYFLLFGCIDRFSADFDRNRISEYKIHKLV